MRQKFHAPDVTISCLVAIQYLISCHVVPRSATIVEVSELHVVSACQTFEFIATCEPLDQYLSWYILCYRSITCQHVVNCDLDLKIIFFDEGVQSLPAHMVQIVTVSCAEWFHDVYGISVRAEVVLLVLQIVRPTNGPI